MDDTRPSCRKPIKLAVIEQHSTRRDLAVHKFECADCGHQTSLTSGTLLEKTHKPLKVWFRAIFEIATQLGVEACAVVDSDLRSITPEWIKRLISPIAGGTLRLVVDDVELDGYLFPAGTMVLMNTFAANRDPSVYDDPDRVDITREGAPAILTFGGGVHYCLGANLARREIAEALNVLTGRLGNPRIAGPVPWKPIVSLSGPKSLPIEFD